MFISIRLKIPQILSWKYQSIAFDAEKKGEREMNITFSKSKLTIAGILCGCIAAVLAAFGNPANMAFCIACFIRDTAGAMGFHSAAPVQYVRPEIIGLILGSFAISAATKEYRSTAGSSPMIRFLLGMIIMIGALAFLGCPLRMVIRMSAGDLNAYVGLVGFIAGVGTGVIALKNGFSLGKAQNTHAASGGVISLIAVGILALTLFTSLMKSSESGPGSKHAPLFLALIAGLVFGAIAQKARMCFAGSLRDVFLMGNVDLLLVIVGLFAAMLVYNLATGHFNAGFVVPGVIAHSEHLWNILGMYAVGFAAVLAGGCPLRQLILAGQGSCDAAVTVLGMFIGAAMCHNFGLAASGTAKNDAGEVVRGALSTNGRIAVVICIILLFVIGFTQKRDKG